MRIAKVLQFLPLILLLSFTQNLFAHTSNQVDHLIWYKFSDAGKRLEVKFVVDFGFETATNMLYLFDKDKNNQINGAEKSAVGQYTLDQWLEEFKVYANKANVSAESSRFEFSGREISFFSGGFTITINALFQSQAKTNEIFWKIDNKFRIYPVGFYKYDIEIRNAIILGKHLTEGKETNPWGLAFALKGFDHDVGLTTFKINEEDNLLEIKRIKNILTKQSESSNTTETPTIETNEKDQDIENTRSKRNENDDRFVSLLQAKPFSIEGLIGLFIAFLLGMYHAMSPGHGKVLVGSYLITSKGTFRDAIFLAMTVTITHTGSVFLFGVVILVLSKNLTPSTFVPYLTLASGSLIIMIGFWIVITRSEHWGSHSHDHSHGHSHGLFHTHSHSHDHEHHHDHDHEHSHTHDHEHHHDHDHEHSHTHDHEHHHDHDHEHSHTHEHEPQVCKNIEMLRDKLDLDEKIDVEIEKSSPIAQPIEDLSGEVFDIGEDEIEVMEISAEEHSHKIQLMAQEQVAVEKPKKKRKSGVSLKELLMLGITGGMVPCPTAIVVLLIAVALGKTVYGLMLIVTFSFGLAFVLGVLGVFMVMTKKFISKSGKFTKLAEVAPVISGILITYIGWLIIFGALHQLGIITFELNFLE